MSYGPSEPYPLIISGMTLSQDEIDSALVALLLFAIRSFTRSLNPEWHAALERMINKQNIEIPVLFLWVVYFLTFLGLLVRV
jgi:molecular chaperone GrpE (heat shock protein)